MPDLPDLIFINPLMDKLVSPGEEFLIAAASRVFKEKRTCPEVTGSPGFTEMFSIVPVVVALTTLLLRNRVNAGRSIVDKTCLYVTGTILTGVLITTSSPTDPSLFLQDGISGMEIEIRTSRKRNPDRFSILIYLLSQKEIHFIYNLELLYFQKVYVPARGPEVLDGIYVFSHLDVAGFKLFFQRHTKLA
jgi:hypothetical protein